MTLPTKELQIRVAGWYPGEQRKEQLPINGGFGPRTAVAVREFQADHGLLIDGVVGPKTEAALNALHDADNSTEHFNWSEFSSRDGGSVGKLPILTVVYNLRLLMWNLEGLRDRLNRQPIRINSGFRTIIYNAKIGGAADSMHQYGLAADISARDFTPVQVAAAAKNCGFSGIISYAGHTHVDLRARIGRSWYWGTA